MKGIFGTWSRPESCLENGRFRFMRSTLCMNARSHKSAGPCTKPKPIRASAVALERPSNYSAA